MDLLQEPYNVYKKYCALKAHFSYQTNYDYIRSNGNIRVSKKSFEQRKDKPLFYFIATKFTETELLPFLVAQFIENPEIYIGEILTEKEIALQNYRAFSARHQNITQHFKLDMAYIVTLGNNWREILIGEGFPPIFNAMYSKRITPETYTILDMIFEFINYKHPFTNLAQNIYNYKYIQYKQFLSISSEQLRKLLKYIPKRIDSDQ